MKGFHLASARSGGGTHARAIKRRAVLTAFLCVAWSRPLVAQELRVTAVDSATGQPLAGVIISVISANGAVRVHGLTDEVGGLRLRTDVGSSIELTGQRVGLADARLGPLTIAVGVQEVTLLLGPTRQRLAGLTITGRSHCGAMGAGTDAAQIWSEVRKALTASTFRARSAPALRVWRYVRTLDMQDRVLQDSVTSREATNDPGFSSAPVISVMQAGFVQTRDERQVYFAPDAAVLLSDAFVQEHCFRAGSAGAGLLALQFSPRPGRSVPDIQGEMLVSSVSSELRSLTFTYVGSGVPREATGRVAFLVLPNGEWAVAQWSLRIPRIARSRAERTGRWTTEEQEAVVGYQEEGGWIALRDGAVSAHGGTVSGTLFDSVSQRPLSGASVSLTGAGPVTLTDSAGRFSLVSPMEGRYQLTITHPVLELYGLNRSSHDIVISRGGAIETKWSVPGMSQVLERVCPGASAWRDRRALLIRVTGTSPGDSTAAVTASWQAQALRREPDRAMARTADSTLQVTLDRAGVAWLCDVPSLSPVTVSAVSRSLRADTTMGADTTGLATVNLVLGRVGALRGRVLARSGTTLQPLPDAEVIDASNGVSVRTGDDGTWLLAPSRSVVPRLLIRKHGFSPRLVNSSGAASEDIVLDALTSSLPLVQVEGTSGSGSFVEFESRRRLNPGGTFMTRAEIVRSGRARVSDLLRTVGGFRVTGTQGKAVLMSTRGRGSIRTGACYSQLVVDGARWWAPGDFQQPPSVDDFTVDLIEAIEVYPGPADTPPAYAGLGATCGTLVIWTRR